MEMGAISPDEQLPDMVTAMTLEKSFPFFALPRELRDNIYIFLVGNDKRLPECYGSANAECKRRYKEAVEMTIKNPRLSNIMRVSKQVKAEYEQSIYQKATLVLSDHDNFRFQDPKLDNDAFASVEHVVYYGIIQCDMCQRSLPGSSRCNALRDIGKAIEWLKRTLSGLPNVATVDLRMGLWWNSAIDHHWPDTPHGDRFQKALRALSEVVGVSTLEVYKCAHEVYDLQEHMESGELFVKWSDKEGWKAPDVLRPP